MVERSKLLMDDHQGREAHKEAFGTWLAAEWDWDWWVTLTYDMRRNTDGSFVKFRPGSGTHTQVGWARSEQDCDDWLREVTKEAAVMNDGLDPPYWFRGREPNPYRYGTHFHMLVGNVGDVDRRDAWLRWYSQHGNARIEPYDPSRGAGFYVAKYVAKELGDIQFSPNLGQHRKDARTDDRAAERADNEAAARDLHPWHVQGQSAVADFRSRRNPRRSRGEASTRLRHQR